MSWPFPELPTRDLEGAERGLPADLEGERNVVILAFQRGQQRLVDSWVPWLETRALDDPGLRFYEVPTIGTGWRPVRAVIDGGMASAIRDRAVRRRTLTAYVPIGPVTAALGITDTSDIWLFLVGHDGDIAWRGRGGFSEETADGLVAALRDAAALPGSVRVFPFAFEPRFVPLLRALGVTPANSEVVVTPERFVARFGRWVVDTPVSNVADARVSGPYRSYRAIGPRGSLADRGATFGSSTAGGVCVLFHEPVTGLEPFGVIKHPGLTVTVEDREGLAALLREHSD
jgi:hypothetical protein